MLGCSLWGKDPGPSLCSPRQWSQRNERGRFLLLEVASLSSDFLGFQVQCLIFGFCSSFLLGSTVGAASMPVPRHTHPKIIFIIKCLAGYSFSNGSRNLDYLTWDTWVATWSSNIYYPTCRRGQGGREGSAGCSQKAVRQMQTGTLSTPSTASSPAQVHLSWWKVIEIHAEETPLCHLCALALN